MLKLPISFIDELAHLGLGEDAEAIVNGYAERNVKRMAHLAEAAYAGEGHAFPICRLQPLGRLAVIVWKLAEIRGRYEVLGVSPEIIAETFSDITLRQILYFQETGTVGMRRADCVWLRHLVNAQIFKLGVLQYQPTNMFYLETYENGSPFFAISEAQKARLPEGTPVLNVHIQAGADLAQERVLESLQMARGFFAQVYLETRFKAMVCYSWLLHTGLKDLLSPDSSILRFAAHFEVVSETGDKRQAVERIFGKPLGSRHLPQKTSLQRAALAAPQKLGFTLGVIYLD